MAENETKQEAVQSEKQTRERSKIAFPYGDLDGAVEVAKAIYNRGGSSAALHQLVDWLGHENVNSGAFRNKVSASKVFGLTEIAKDNVTLTALGKQIADPKTEAHARASAFLKVPLYKKIFDDYKGGPLPKDSDLETFMKGLGVPSKQTDRARQSFQRSADQANVLNEKKDRLVLPAGVSIDSTSTPANGENGRKMEHQQQPQFTRSGDVNPVLSFLLKSLPSGSEWSHDARQQWMRMLELALDEMYKPSDE